MYGKFKTGDIHYTFYMMLMTESLVRSFMSPLSFTLVCGDEKCGVLFYVWSLLFLGNKIQEKE